MTGTEHRISLAGKPYSLYGKRIHEGQIAPDFYFTGIHLTRHNFYSFKKSYKLISVFPSIDTGVCSSQNIFFDKKAAEFSDNVKFIAISTDLPFSIKRFYETKCLSHIEMISDHNYLDFGKKYGMLIQELRLLTRAVIIVDDKNIVRYIEHVREITDHPDYSDAIKTLKRLLKESDMLIHQ